MDNLQKTLNISITKIFNWPDSGSQSSFDLIFYSQLESIEIIKKSIAGVYDASSMNLNAYLKITYTTEQRKVILKLFQRQSDQLLGTFQIDLQELDKKGVLYYPFRKQSVLQINKYEPKNNKSSPRRQELQDQMYHTYNQLRINQTNEHYITQKQQKLTQKMYSTDLNGLSINNKNKVKNTLNFNQKVAALLQEVREIKRQNNIGYNNKLTRVDTQIYQQKNNIYSASHQQQSMKKNSKMDLNALRNDKRRSGEAYNNTHHTQRHKLVLNTLNIVAYDLNDSDENVEEVIV